MTKLEPNVLPADNLPSPLTFGAIGDAYGFCFEFTSAEFVAKNNDLEYHQHPGFANVRPGSYSDDTQMQIALAEVIASEKEWTAQNIAQSFIDVFKRDPRPGYAKHFNEFLNRIKTAEQFLAEIKPKSERNGAAMRSPVIGLFSKLEEVVVRAELQAKLTHDTKGGVDSSIAAALMAHYFAYNLGPKDHLPAFLTQHVPGYDWNPVWSGAVPVHGIFTVQAAVRAVCESENLADLLKNCVSFSGDVDSVATIALASASGHAGFKRNIPDSLWKEFEPTKFGLSYLIELDRKTREVIGITSELAKTET